MGSRPIFSRFVADIRDQQFSEELDTYIQIRQSDSSGLFTRQMMFEEMFTALKEQDPELVKRIKNKVRG